MPPIPRGMRPSFGQDGTIRIPTKPYEGVLPKSLAEFPVPPDPAAVKVALEAKLAQATSVSTSSESAYIGYCADYVAEPEENETERRVILGKAMTSQETKQSADDDAEQFQAAIDSLGLDTPSTPVSE